MTYANSSNAANITTGPILAQGWVNQPDGRGTIDVLWSCVITILFCSWSVLCLNIPPQGKGRYNPLLKKLRWVLFTIFAPEVVTALAADQWASARQSVEDFTKLDHKLQWTMRHAFFADMGGFVLKSPDFPTFPVDAQQMHYLVANNYIPFPAVDVKDIRDKNKADDFARFITVWQTGWFAVQCIGRASQHLSLSTFELSTLAFVFCTIPTFYFWQYKTLDAEIPITLETDTLIANVRTKAGYPAHDPYALTPLDFVRPPPTDGRPIRAVGGSMPFWYSLERMLGLCKYPNVRPIETFGNTKRIAPRGLSFMEATIGSAIATGYTGLHLIGWNFVFPTYIEQTFWRVASSTLVGLLVGYLLFISVGSILADRIAQTFFSARATSIMELFYLLPSVVQVFICLPAMAAYGSARLYIIVEAFISLRALPMTAYDSVNWSNFIPHF